MRKFKNSHSWQLIILYEVTSARNKSVKDGDEAAGQDRGDSGDQGWAAQGDFLL